MLEFKLSPLFPFIKNVPRLLGSQLYDHDNVVNTEFIQLKRIKLAIATVSFTIRAGKLFVSDDNTGVVPSLIKWLDDDEIALVDNKNPPQRHLMETYGSTILPLIHPGIEIFGHWLIDLAATVRLFQQIYPARNYIIGLPGSAPSYARELLNIMFGPSIQVIELMEAVSYRAPVFLHTPTRYHDYLSEFCSPQPALELRGSTRIYLSRKRISSYRKLLNFEEVEDCFSRRGFNIIEPEELTLAEQLELFQSASIISGEAGSALHSCIFSSKHTYVINIQSSRQNHFIQAGLCNWLSQPCVYVVGKSITDDWTSDYSVNINQINEAINLSELQQLTQPMK